MRSEPQTESSTLEYDDESGVVISSKPARPSTVYHHPNRPPMMNRAMRRKLDAIERKELKTRRNSV